MTLKRLRGLIDHAVVSAMKNGHRDKNVDMILQACREVAGEEYKKGCGEGDKEKKEYAKQKCKEQRKICWEEALGYDHRGDCIDAILDAPEPDFESGHVIDATGGTG